MKYYEISPKNVKKLQENDDDLFSTRARPKVILHTSGDGYWSNVSKEVPVVDLRIQYVDEEKEFGELCVYFNTAVWDVEVDGLIYTDPLFLKELRNYLNANGLPGNDVDYSEQGMQSDDYVSCDIGEEFIAAWEAKFGPVTSLYENNSGLISEAELELDEPPAPERKTKTKTKPDINFDPFQQQQDQPIANRPEEPQGKQRPQGPTLRKASQSNTQRATAGIRLPPEALRHLQNLGNIEIDPDLSDYPASPEEPELLPSTRVNTENLPAVAGQALAAEGITSPEFHQVANLPGNMSRMIRQLGKLLFGSMTNTPTEEIYMIGNLGGQGPNSRMDVNSVANFAREHGEDLGPGDIDFARIMPGYTAQTHQYSAAGIRFLLVNDFAGQYIYCWPEADSKTPISQAQLSNKPKQLGENDDDLFAVSHRVQQDIEDFNHPLKNVGNCDKGDYDMLINEIDYTINVIGDDEDDLSAVIDELEYRLDPMLVKFLDSVLAGAIAVSSDRFNRGLVQALRDGEQRYGTEPKSAVLGAVDALNRGWKAARRQQGD